MSFIGRPRIDAAATTTYNASPNSNKLVVDAGHIYPKQAEFWKAKELYVCYGGARGGGKSHVVDRKAIYGALEYPGFKGLIVRRQFDDLLENHIEPMKKLLPQEVAEYNGSTHMMYFYNGSTIKFGHYNYDASADKYQGQEYDWIFMDEATQFTEQQFRMLGGCLRGTTDVPKHFYLTCNPGGIGHRWVKRLFIDREFSTKENPKDYKFIFASVEDNKALIDGSPGYISMLDNLPERLRAAHRYGDWNALSGAYFDEFSTEKHVIKPFDIPKDWRRYRAFDYGLDMFACYWIAVDFSGRCYVYREYLMGKDMDGGRGLIVAEAAAEIHNNTLPGEHIDITFAPPDMWNTQKTDGKTMAEDFMLNDVPIIKVSNSRVQGHLQIKSMLADMPDEKPQLVFFDNCKHIVDDLPAIQADELNPNDCAKLPHSITHTVDAIRYFAVSRSMPAIQAMEKTKRQMFDDDEVAEDYENYMCGGEPSSSYIGS